MKLCVDAREFTPRGTTGIARYLFNLVAPLTGRAGWEWILYARHPECVPLPLHVPNVTIRALPSWPDPLVDHLLFPQWIAKDRPDYFFSPYYKTPFRGGGQRVITVHDIMFLRIPTTPPLKTWIIHGLVDRSIRKADLILVDSDFTGRDLVDLFPASAPKIRRLYPDLDPAWATPPDPGQVRDIQGALQSQPYVLYVGNFRPHKNVDLLVQAFSQWQATHPGQAYHLILAGGDPANVARIESRIQASPAAHRIHIRRAVSEDTLRALYAGAAGFITASCYEGFGYPVIEAFACQCPVLCHASTSVGELGADCTIPIPELTAPGVGRALETLASLTPEQRQALVAKGTRRARTFKAGTAAMEFERILR